MISNFLSLYILLNTNAQAPTISLPSPTEQTEIRTASAQIYDFESFDNPQKDPQKIKPIIDASASIAVDLDSSFLLFEKNIHERLQIASITKLMTVLVVLEENDPQEIATVTHEANLTEGSTMHLRTNETITVENLIKGALINSGNDAATALAIHNAGSTEEFVKKMNLKAKELGLINTNFANPTGLDHPNNYSSAYDLSRLAKHVYKYPLVKETAQTANTVIYSADGQFSHNLKNTNKLLNNEHFNIKGLKTGRTDGAGECLVSISEDQGQEIITIVLNSPDRFQETKILSNWVFQSYKW